MTEILTFGELCEAIAQGKRLEYLDGDTWRDDVLLNVERQIKSVSYYHGKNKYRIKPEPVFKYNWIIKTQFGYIITSEKLTKDEAESMFKGMVVEPYLPTKEPV